MKKLYLFISILATFALSSCSSDDEVSVETLDFPTENQNWKLTDYLNLTNAEQTTALNLQPFYYNFIKEAGLDANGSNFCCSPLSAEMYMSALANGADGESLNQILTALNAEDLESLNAVNEKFMHYLPNPNKNVMFKVNTSFWVADRFSVSPEFKSAIQSVFNGNVESVDFSNPATVPTINKWVSYQTNGLIDGLLYGSWKDFVNLPMACTNSFYFKADWHNQFNPEETKNEKFKSPKGSKTVKMMNMVEHTRYSSNDKFQYVIKNFSNNTYMELFLPAEGMSMNEAIKLLTPEMHNNLSWSSMEYEVTLGLPSFTTKNMFDIAPIMEKLGVNMKAMNLSGIGIGTQSVGSNQESCLKVHEEGVEFAVVTGGAVSSPGTPVTYPKVEIKFNRPFIYIIYNSNSSAILLAGAVVNP